MSNYSKSKGRSEKRAFIMIQNHMLDSDAFKNLSGGAVRVLLLLIRRHNGMNNGKISLSCREIALYYKAGKGSASKWLSELQVSGFISIVKKGRFTTRYATTWRLTFLRTYNDYGTPSRPTDEWKQYNLKQKKVPNIELQIPL